MMSILTGLILVVVLGAIVQKSDTLMDAFSDFTSDETEEAGASPDAAPTPPESTSDTIESASSESPATEPATEAARAPTSGEAAEQPRVAATALGDVAGYRASLDDVTIEAGGTYSIDVLGNDVGVRPDIYGRLKLLSLPKCGVARLVDGRVAYFADVLCQGAQYIFYCVEGAAAEQCEQGVLTIHILQSGNATLDPARMLRDVAPNIEGFNRPDRAPKVDTSVSTPNVGDRPSALQSAKSPRAAGSDLPQFPATGGFRDEGEVLATALPRGGLFADGTVDDAPPPVANDAVGQPNAVALLDNETAAAPLESPARNAASGRGLALSPLPVAKPSIADHAAPEAPRIARGKGLQTLAVADASAPSGGSAATRVIVRDASKVELLFERQSGDEPPNSRIAAAAALIAPDAGGDTPEIASLSGAGIKGAAAMTLSRTDYASVASEVRAESGGAVDVNRIGRLKRAPEPAAPDADAPGDLRIVAVEKGVGGAGNFTSRDFASVADRAEEVQPLTSFLKNFSSAPPEGVSQGLGEVQFEDPPEAATAADQRALGAGRIEIASKGPFTLRDKPAKAIPRESLVVDSGGSSSETPKIAPVEIAALNRDNPDNLRGNGAAGGSRRAPAAPAGCDLEFDAVGVRGALVRVRAESPCRAGKVVRFVHQEIEFATRFDANGVAELLPPALDRDAVVLARAEDAEEAYARATAPGMGRVSRVVLTWSDALDLNLHAFEYGAGIGAKGHVWERSGQDLTNYKRGRSGLLQSFKPIDGFGDYVEIYSFAPGRRSTDGAMEIAVEFASRGAKPAAPFCGSGELASPRFALLRVTDGRLGPPTEASFAAAACGETLAEAMQYERGLTADVVVSK
jgi:hypothetical protein